MPEKAGRAESLIGYEGNLTALSGDFMAYSAIR